MKTFHHKLLAASLSLSLVASGFAAGKGDGGGNSLPQLQAPVGLSANTANCGRAILSWGAIPGATGYHVVISGNVPSEKTALGTSLALADLVPGNYIYKVKANGTPGSLRDSDFSITHAFTVGACVVCSQPPVVTLSAGPAVIWPPNHKLVPVVLNGSITQTAGCSLLGASYRVIDEYGSNQTGSLPVGVNGGSFSVTVYVEAWRLGTDMDGRHYDYVATATNSAGTGSSVLLHSLVPHDQR